MKVSYRREMKYNYMIINPEGTAWRSYECQMLEENVIDGLLRFQTRQSNGLIQFYYEITSRQPLGRLLENRTISGEEIRRLVIGISNVLDQIERYLLDESSILLTPEYIYVEPDSFRIWLCLVPGVRQDFPGAYSELLEYILGKVNHQDKDSVVLAYGLYQETRKENYGMEDILRLLQQSPPPVLPESRKEVSKTGEVPKSPEQVSLRNEAAEMRDVLPDRKRTESKSLWMRIKSFFTGSRRRKQEEGSEPGSFPMNPLSSEHYPPDQLPWQAMFLDEEEDAGHYAFTPNINMAPSSSVSSPSLAALSSSSAIPSSSKTVSSPSLAEPLSSKAVSLPLSTAPPPEKAGALSEMGAAVPVSFPPSDFTPAGQGTVLLSDFSPKETLKRLRALDSGEADITLSYYPFVIGKQENLVDYILNHETVSRLHLRIDRIGADYQIMDLNSTNGTIVRGRLLENNESVPLHPGDEVQIAKYRYRFE